MTDPRTIRGMSQAISALRNDVKVLEAERDRLREALHDAEQAASVEAGERRRAHAERDRLREEIKTLRLGLHRVSLASQDSGTTKEHLGREARKTIHDADCQEAIRMGYRP